MRTAIAILSLAFLQACATAPTTVNSGPERPNLSESELFQLRLKESNRLLLGLPATRNELETFARRFQKELPNHDNGYTLMLSVIRGSDPEQARALANELIDGPAPERVKVIARGYLHRLETVGKPLKMQFTALDGREVNVADMNGKVVLIEFWATWCAPCIAGLPRLKAMYDRFHTQGFEVIGISLDEDKTKLKKFVDARRISWPQYYDDGGKRNRFVLEFGIRGIPTVWLVDKQGNLRVMDAKGWNELAGKLVKLLEEK